MMDTIRSAGASARKDFSEPGQFVILARKSAPKNISAVVISPITVRRISASRKTFFAP